MAFFPGLPSLKHTGGTPVTQVWGLIVGFLACGNPLGPSSGRRFGRASGSRRRQAAAGSPWSTSERIRSGRPAATEPSARAFIRTRPRTKWRSNPKSLSSRPLIRSRALRRLYPRFQDGQVKTCCLVFHNVSEFENVFMDTADHMNRSRYHTLKLNDLRLVQREQVI